MNKIYILTSAFIIMFFIFSCKNVNILNPNENDVEVFYTDNYKIVEYTNAYTNGWVDEDGRVGRGSYHYMHFKIKKYKDKFKNIYIHRIINENSLSISYEQCLISYNGDFSIRFTFDFFDLISGINLNLVDSITYISYIINLVILNVLLGIKKKMVVMLQ